jgi:hypothetical protein
LATVADRPSFGAPGRPATVTDRPSFGAPGRPATVTDRPSFGVVAGLTGALAAGLTGALAADLTAADLTGALLTRASCLDAAGLDDPRLEGIVADREGIVADREGIVADRVNLAVDPRPPPSETDLSSRPAGLIRFPAFLSMYTQARYFFRAKPSSFFYPAIACPPNASW